MELQPFEIVTRNGEFICMQKNSQIHSNGKISMFSGLDFSSSERVYVSYVAGCRETTG